ncbi:hypothetical protein [Massilia sp. BSC265]|uniref:hypothetical protein n=1 Tax=Massilia sp. BSC265 TaxID=1549812 RepID=UPI00126A0DC1|nr:hypothetical protein [Massilia sp. BSC265]
MSSLLAGLVVLTIPRPRPAGTAAPVPAPPVPSARVPAPMPLAPAGRPPARGAQPDSTWREMHAKFVHAPNLRVFFYEAMRKPGSGAYFYATNVLETCRRALEQTLPALPAPRRAAAEELQRRCDFTPEGLEDAERELGAARHLDLATDPLMGSMFDYLAADGPEGRARMLLAAFEQGNPEVIASLVAPVFHERVPVRDEQDSTARGVPFGGALLACRLGADCGPGAPRTLELCMLLGWCADSVPAALQQGLGVHFAALDGLANQVVNEIRRRDPRRLVPAPR